MRKLVIVQKEIDKANGLLTHTTTKTLEKYKIKQESVGQCFLVMGSTMFQVNVWISVWLIWENKHVHIGTDRHAMQAHHCNYMGYEA